MTLPAPVQLTNASGSGIAYEHGAHLVSWTPAESAPVLWISSLAHLEPGIAIRGGVPIIFPWFGAGRSGDLSPAHGFARTRTWELLESGANVDESVATFTLDGDGTDQSSFPYAYAAFYEVRLGSTLSLSLTVENRDSRLFSFEQALHAYFSVGDVSQVVVEGLDGCTYLDQADGLSTKVQSGGVTFSGETDRIYESSGSVRVIDPVIGRVLVISKESSASTVVWNPWVDKARRMSDFGDDEWAEMVCIEGGNLRANAVELAPGASHTMRYSVTVEQL